jgi:DNA primase
VLAEARPLADLIWSRETSGGVFDTPERRAELERTLREVTGRIRDESVRYHYQQEMRERVHAYFGATRTRPARPGERDRPGQGGQWARGGQATGRIAVTESLSRSALVRRSGGPMPPREALLIVALVNHPALGDENFDQVEQLEIGHPDLAALQAAVIDAHAHRAAADRATMIETIVKAGLGEAWERAVALVRRTRLWPALEDAALDDAREAFRQALHLQVSAGALHKELKAAEAALAADPTDENHRHLVEIQAQFRAVQAQEALIDGFGVSSGRAARNF